MLGQGGLILIGNDYNNGIVWEVDFMGEGTVLYCFVSFLLLFYGLHLDKGLGYSTTYVFVSQLAENWQTEFATAYSLH